ncbi:hypothetical protein LTS08_004054 [Lithohypha guttulata]|uniref:Uncharacterized protein n=1 Tax=Lithohypha guttulata TaxID=1690604 RepID=A0AAN7SXE1_9EURO|nr:hypothetical protein LTR51_000990 [Lithohypha guttulata]KAK5083861.1 hypothetical protein LTR05_006368 [Lithohypha guttulata]KAK5103247.1 hypothetical protein LTS08_004054 [Lithohypha guttulata]
MTTGNIFKCRIHKTRRIYSARTLPFKKHIDTSAAPLALSNLLVSRTDSTSYADVMTKIKKSTSIATKTTIRRRPPDIMSMLKKPPKNLPENSSYKRRLVQVLSLDQKIQPAAHDQLQANLRQLKSQTHSSHGPENKVHYLQERLAHEITSNDI